MANVSVQNERINGWIPSSATNVIMNCLKGSKPNHTMIGTIVFCRLTQKGPCGMTVNIDINYNSATKHGDSHRSPSSSLTDRQGLTDLAKNFLQKRDKLVFGSLVLLAPEWTVLKSALCRWSRHRALWGHRVARVLLEENFSGLSVVEIVEEVGLVPCERGVSGQRHRLLNWRSASGILHRWSPHGGGKGRKPNSSRRRRDKRNTRKRTKRRKRTDNHPSALRMDGMTPTNTWANVVSHIIQHAHCARENMTCDCLPLCLLQQIATSCQRNLLQQTFQKKNYSHELRQLLDVSQSDHEELEDEWSHLWYCSKGIGSARSFPDSQPMSCETSWNMCANTRKCAVRRCSVHTPRRLQQNVISCKRSCYNKIKNELHQSSFHCHHEKLEEDECHIWYWYKGIGSARSSPDSHRKRFIIVTAARKSDRSRFDAFLPELFSVNLKHSSLDRR